MTQSLIDKCPVCENEGISSSGDSHRDIYVINCPRCGNYRITRQCRTNLPNEDFSKRQRMNASSKIRQDGNVILTTENDSQFFNTPNMPVLDRMDKILLWLEKKVDEGETATIINIADLSLQAMSWSIDAKEFEYLLRLLVKRDLIEDALFRNRTISITFKGWERLEKLRVINTDSAQGFIAMPFKEEFFIKYDTILAPSIEKAGYRPHKVDNREYNDKIDDEVILQIRRSRFIVADLTDGNPNVYFELGFAEGCGLPSFQICKDGTNMQFDRRQYNTIFWGKESDEETKNKLAARIEAVLGRGPFWKKRSTEKTLT